MKRKHIARARAANGKPALGGREVEGPEGMLEAPSLIRHLALLRHGGRGKQAVGEDAREQGTHDC